MEIRLMTKNDDRLEISRIYEESWKYAYKDIIPQSYLDSIPVGQWASGLDRDGRNTLLMLDGSRIIGTSSYCKSRFPKFSGMGEIISIYLLPRYIGRGYGKQLLDSAIKNLGNSGYNEVFLWVLEENSHARRFYEKFGFVKSGEFLNDNIGGKDLREIQYCYRIG